ncbi:MAG TPA: tetratricopeptide repeat protein [Candidatus Binatia bacterium]|nr:tetratricopeptide repeat protein [Candidatus Binatia bacterium]
MQAAGTARTQHLPHPRQKRTTILCLVLVMLTLAFYNPVAHNQFTNYDDDAYIVGNAHVKNGLSWSTVKWAFTSFDCANWHPLTWLSHALDYQLFQLNPAGPHYVNVLLHAGNALLLFLLLEAATALTWPSFVVAGLFALHPMNVESVAWAAERKNVLSMFFMLLAMYAYGKYARQSTLRRYALVIFLFALGLMAKPEIITLPFVLLLWDFWPLNRVLGFQSPVLSGNENSNRVQPRPVGFLVLEKIPLLLLSLGSAIVTMLAQKAGHAVRVGSFRVRFGNAAVAYMRYIGKMFWPRHLAVLYPHPGRYIPNWQIAASCFALVAITALVLVYRKHGYLPVGWFWFLGTLVPVIGLVQVGVQSMADRYAYIPYVGLFICLVWGAAGLAQQYRLNPAWLAAGAAVALVALGVVTQRQISYWRDSETLWRHALAVTQQNYVAHDALARDLARQGRIDESIAEHKAAQKLHAYGSADMIDIGVFEQTHGRAQDAIEQFGWALNAAEDAKSRSDALSFLGSAFLQTGDLRRAGLSYNYALRENPENTSALLGSGLLAERQGDLDTALGKIAQAAKIIPSDLDYLILEQVLRRAGRTRDADEARSRAERVSHDFPFAQQAAAQVLSSAGITPQ